MLNKRRKWEKLPDYAVRFIGYSARIIARKGNAEHAFLDFVSGADAVKRAPAPIRKSRRSIMDALLRLHTHRRAGRPIVARMGHIVIYHRCRSRLVGGA
jgi:hypothetical protein